MAVLRALTFALIFSASAISLLNAQDQKTEAAVVTEAPASLVGVWSAEKVLSSGREVPKEKFPFELHFTPKQLTYKFVGTIQGKDRVHDLSLDPSKTPATIDISRMVGEKRMTVLGIYKVEDERLWICFLRSADGNPSEHRPSTFESSNDVKSDLLILKQKPQVTE